MAGFSATAIAEQTVNPGESVVFTASVNHLRNFISFNNETGATLLSGNVPSVPAGCPCCADRTVDYPVAFGANIAIPDGQTVGEISVAFSVDGVTDPASVMRTVPAAVAQYQNVCRVKNVGVWKQCGCQRVSVRNTSNIPILVKEATLDIDGPAFI